MLKLFSLIFLLLLLPVSSHAQSDFPVARPYHRLADKCLDWAISNRELNSKLFKAGYPASAYCDCAARATIAAMQWDDIRAVMQAEPYSQNLGALWTNLQSCTWMQH